MLEARNIRAVRRGIFPVYRSHAVWRPDLRAEQSISVDVGFDQRVARDRAEFTYSSDDGSVLEKSRK